MSNRVDVVSAAEPYPEASPTGTPLFGQTVVKALAFAVAVAVAAQEALPDHTIGDSAAGWIVKLGTFALALTQGWRK